MMLGGAGSTRAVGVKGQKRDGRRQTAGGKELGGGGGHLLLLHAPHIPEHVVVRGEVLGHLCIGVQAHDLRIGLRGVDVLELLDTADEIGDHCVCCHGRETGHILDVPNRVCRLLEEFIKHHLRRKRALIPAESVWCRQPQGSAVVCEPCGGAAGLPAGAELSALPGRSTASGRRQRMARAELNVGRSTTRGGGRGCVRSARKGIPHLEHAAVPAVCHPAAVDALPHHKAHSRQRVCHLIFCSGGVPELVAAGLVVDVLEQHVLDAHDEVILGKAVGQIEGEAPIRLPLEQQSMEVAESNHDPPPLFVAVLLQRWDGRDLRARAEVGGCSAFKAAVDASPGR